MMNEYITICPCCGKQLKISISSSGDVATFLLDKNKISQKELSDRFGIELGIVESNKEME